ncbi:MAG TPA: hypothetical protein VM940_09805 [Chthoniobacterales bacterium]|nr:hypothetical protein [Chthoniobacterales bacterium]
MTAGPQNETPRPERLRRLDRIFPQVPIYFVTACTFGRKALLARREVHEAYIRFIYRGEEHGAYVGSYVLMPDHLHFGS